MAAEKVGSIYYDLDLDDTKFRQGMKSTDGLMKKAEKGSMALLTGITALGVGLGVLGVSALDSANDMDKAQLKYETLLGSVDAAKARVKELTDFAAKTPFQLTEIQQADTLLQGFGIRSKELLTIIGDAAAISGSNFTDLSLVIGQLSQSKDLENIKQLVERGVVSFDELRKAGIKFAKDGSVVNSVEETYSAVVAIMQGKFGGGMDKLSDTLEGRISTLKDNFSLALGQMAKDSGLADIAKEAISKLSTALEGISWDDIKKKIEELQPTLVILSTTVLFALIPAFWGLATAVWAALAPLLPFIAAGVLLGIAINKLVEHFGGWEPLVTKVKESLQKLWDLVSPWLIPAFEEMKRVIIEELWPALKELWAQISPVLLPALKVLAIIIGVVLIAALYAAIKIVTWLANVLTDWAKKTEEKIGKAKAWFEEFKAGIKRFAEEFENRVTAAKYRFGEFVEYLKGKIEALKNKLIDLGNKAKEALDKINPFHRESPSLVDWVTKGTSEISGMYDDMFARIGGMTAEGRVNLVSGAKASENIASPTSINISLNPSGIIARSSGELRDVARDMLDAINEDLQSRGINMLGK